MNTEIRAYHKIKKKIFTVSMIDFLTDSCKLLKPSGEEFSNRIPLIDVVLLQKTGRTDDYDNELWEGDKLHISGYYWVDEVDGEKGIIDSEASVIYQDKAGAFVMKDSKGCTTFFDWDLIEVHDKKIKKIGEYSVD